MPEIKSCPTCRGNAYSEPKMSGTIWVASPGRSEVARLSGELQAKEVYVEVLENRVSDRDERIAKLEAELALANRKIQLFRDGLTVVRDRHFVTRVTNGHRHGVPPDEIDHWKNGVPCPGAQDSFWLDSRKAFALLEDEYLQKELKK